MIFFGQSIPTEWREDNLLPIEFCINWIVLKDLEQVRVLPRVNSQIVDDGDLEQLRNLSKLRTSPEVLTAQRQANHGQPKSKHKR